MNKDTWHMIERLKSSGITEKDAFALRRIAMTLHRWHELECGVDGGWYIERETEDEDSPPHMKNGDTGKDYGRVADREAGALKRLKSIMDRYPGKSAYVQGDPRGASLYILNPGDVPEGQDVNGYYSQGIAVYK